MRTLILLTVLSFITLPAFAQLKRYMIWEAEDFSASKGSTFEVFEVPSDQSGDPEFNGDNYTITEASGDAFLGSLNMGVYPPETESRVRYNFSTAAGDWHFWSRVIAPQAGTILSFGHLISRMEIPARIIGI